MRKLQGIGFGNGFLHVTPKAQAAEEKQMENEGERQTESAWGPRKADPV